MTPERAHAGALTLDLASDRYRDALLGCWMGKNAGGTLGAPLEDLYTTLEPHAIDWYPELREGGIPNDDLEMQLVWLLALEALGPGLTARDLADYWLDHIGYNWDEYGLAKANLKRGLVPPFSGSFDNWFADCMGSPIRSEVWACVAPGQPRLAARLALQDAIVDHAGGEGVHGEVFNAALESAAFVVDDRAALLDIANSYIPADSASARIVGVVRAAHTQGLTWQEARRAVLDAVPQHVAQYSPANLGFQVIGLLYGRDFGDAMCITVNCGLDTDSSGAAIGAYWGILAGESNLPERWIAPLGRGIATNEDWGGVRHLTTGAHRIPDDLDELANRLTAAALRTLSHHGVLIDGTSFTTTHDALFADPGFAADVDRAMTRAPWPLGPLHADVALPDGPSFTPGGELRVTLHLSNPRRTPVSGEIRLEAPAGWTEFSAEVALDPGEEHSLAWVVVAPDSAADRVSLQVRFTSPGRSGTPATIPVQLVPARRYLLRDASGTTETVWGHGDRLPTRIGQGSVRLTHTVVSSVPRPAWLVVDVDRGVTVLADGHQVLHREAPPHLRPSLHGPDGAGVSINLAAGPTTIDLHVDAGEGTEPLHGYLRLSSDDDMHHSYWDLDRSSPTPGDTP